MKLTLRLGLTLILLGLLMGHGDGCCSGEEEIFGPSTEAVCPPGSTLTYNNFAKPFMEKYCISCHSSELMGEDRQGAPSFHDFDTLSGIEVVAAHVDMTTAAGPAVINRGMPPSAPRPTDDERYQLGEWLACGLPE